LDRAGKPYAFAGRVIRLNDRDLLNWRQRYHAIPDLIAELWEFDDWWAKQPEAEQRNWFERTKRNLNRKHQEYAAKASVGESPGDRLVQDILRRNARQKQREAEAQRA
jgi:hypothetical protein